MARAVSAGTKLKTKTINPKRLPWIWLTNAISAVLRMLGFCRSYTKVQFSDVSATWRAAPAHGSSISKKWKFCQFRCPRLLITCIPPRKSVSIDVYDLTNTCRYSLILQEGPCYPMWHIFRVPRWLNRPTSGCLRWLSEDCMLSTN